jgi:hypothetical protein
MKEVETPEERFSKASDRVIVYRDEDAKWDWDSSAPVIYMSNPYQSYAGCAKFDPFPCYTHPKDLVVKTVEHVEKCFPIGFRTFYHVFPYECIGRTNGQASTDTVTYASDDQGATWVGEVQLHGKRIPLHPAMTRYLVAHEYGHIVDNWINWCMKKQFDALDKDYARMRNIPDSIGYGGRKWHNNVGEVIANDFRILCTNTEVEFWPHDCKHPLEDDNAKNWWYEAMLKYSHPGYLPMKTKAERKNEDE